MHNIAFPLLSRLLELKPHSFEVRKSLLLRSAPRFEARVELAFPAIPAFEHQGRVRSDVGGVGPVDLHRHGCVIWVDPVFAPGGRGEGCFRVVPVSLMSYVSSEYERTCGGELTDPGQDRHPALVHVHLSGEGVGFDFCRVRHHTST